MGLFGLFALTALTACVPEHGSNGPALADPVAGEGPCFEVNVMNGLNDAQEVERLFDCFNARGALEPLAPTVRYAVDQPAFGIAKATDLSDIVAVTGRLGKTNTGELTVWAEPASAGGRLGARQSTKRERVNPRDLSARHSLTRRARTEEALGLTRAEARG